MYIAPKRGWIELRKLYRDNPVSMHSGETRWFWTAGREHGLWYLTIHAFGLYFGIIGPFQFGRRETA